jgi:hypothetical protein
VEAAGLVEGPDQRFAVEALEVVAPTFVSRPRRDVWVSLTRGEAGWAAQITAGGDLVCQARVSLVPASADAPRPPPPLSDAEPADALYRPDLLFHGPAWQVLRRIECRTESAEADLGPGLDGLSTVAAAVDGAHQLLAAWSGRSQGWLGLPVGADRWVAEPSLARVVRLETRPLATARELRATVIGRDAAGRVVLRGDGVRLRAARRDDA